MSTTAGPLLRIRNLTVSLGGSARPSPRADGPPVRLVDGVSFDVGRREIVGLVGESGSGKSLTGLATLGLLPRGLDAQADKLHFDGRELDALPAAARRAVNGAGLAMLFQDPLQALTPWLRVGRIVAEAAARRADVGRRQAQARAIELLARVGLERPAEVARAYPHELSGGMRQRALLAAAVAAGPSLLWADEPTSALDTLVQARILRLLADLRREDGLAVVLVTHDLATLAGLADRVVVLHAGRVAEDGPASAVLTAPRHPYTRGLLDALPGVDPGQPMPTPIPGRAPRPAERPTGCTFAERCRFAQERCVEQPPLRDVAEKASGHRVACWLA